MTKYKNDYEKETKTFRRKKIIEDITTLFILITIFLICFLTIINTQLLTK